MNASTPHPTGPARSEPRTADRILDVAEELFAERGFAGTAVRDIATRAGLNPASLYNHFENKQALYDAVVERGVRPIYAILDRILLDDGGPDRDAIAELMAHLSAAPGLARLIQHEALAGGEHALRLAGRWLEPMYARASAALAKSPALGQWEPHELPLLLMTYHHLIFGHFAMAGALGELLGVDLLSPDAVERQTRFVEKLSERLLGADADARRGDSA